MRISQQRRNFLKWFGAAGFSAATLPLTRIAMAEDNYPRRAIFVFMPDGMVPDSWHAQGIGSDFTLPAMTQPLDRVRQHCVFLNGIDMFGPGSTHEGGCAKLLTGGPGRSNDGLVSLDYYLGQQFRTSVIRPHLNLNVVPIYHDKHISFDLNGVPVAAEKNPLAAFESLFGVEAGDNIINQRHLSVLDTSLSELNAIRSQLGSVEQTKLDMHLASLRELEQKLTSDDVGACPAWNFNPTNFEVTRTGLWDNPEYLDAQRMELIGDLHRDVAVHALACDLTRVVTLKWNNSVNNNTMSVANTSKSCHQASHEGGDDFIRIKAWYTEQLAKLIEQLANTPEGSGSLLDNTLIFVGSDLANGSWHNHTDMPFILAGGSAGGIQGGRSLMYDSVPHNRILVSVAQFMGININSFGTEDSSPGPLSGLTV